MHKSLTAVGVLAASLLVLAPAAHAQQGGMAPQGAQAQKGERHPEIRRALHALERAKNDLEHAAHDFGGHRAQALQLVNQAIEQLHQALQFDKK